MSEFENRMRKIEEKFFKVLSTNKPIFYRRESKAGVLEKFGLSFEQFAEDLKKKADVAKASMDEFLNLVNS